MEIKSIMGSTSRLGSLSLNRKTTTNPFEHNSFKGKTFTGNALPFADVFQSIKPIEQKPNKIKMVASSVVGAVSDFKTRLTQPIVNFAHEVKSRVVNSIESVKNAGRAIADMGKSLHGRISSVFEINKSNVEDVNAPRILSMRHINNKASVEDLKTTWLSRNQQLANAESRKVVA